MCSGASQPTQEPEEHMQVSPGSEPGNDSQQDAASHSRSTPFTDSRQLQGPRDAPPQWSSQRSLMWAWLGVSVVGCLLSLPSDAQAALLATSAVVMIAPGFGVIGSCVYFFNHTTQTSTDNSACHIKVSNPCHVSDASLTRCRTLFLGWYDPLRSAERALWCLLM